MRVWLILSCVSVFFVSCERGPKDPDKARLHDSAVIAENNAAGQLDGTWRSQGYGWAIKINGKKLAFFDYTDGFCIANPQAAKSMDQLGVQLFQHNSDSFALQYPFEPYQYQFDKVVSLPRACTVSAPSVTPDTILKSYVEIFDQHYAFFNERGLDWQQMKTALQADINTKMSDIELYTALAMTTRQINDAHTELNAKIKGKELTARSGDGVTHAALNTLGQARGLEDGELYRQWLLDVVVGEIKDEIISGEAKGTGNSYILWGKTKDGVGYISFIAMANFSGGDPEEDKALLESILDDALSEFKEAPAIILDYSANHGGYDWVGRHIAERFTAEPRLAYSKKAGDYPNQPYQEVWLKPDLQRPHYYGPVYVLTSDFTVSAGEVGVMSLRALPNVIHAGMPTRGALSDILEKQLLNGWEIELSNEVYKDHEGNFWEAKGIKPHWQIPVYDPENPMSGRVGAIETITQKILNDTEHRPEH
ncbi:MAG: S41 family peptidase [bacterium]